MVWSPLKEPSSRHRELEVKYISGTDINTGRMAEMETAPPGGYTFPMVRYTDMDDEMKKEVS